jgi:peroxiredoxin
VFLGRFWSFKFLFSVYFISMILKRGDSAPDIPFLLVGGDWQGAKQCSLSDFRGKKTVVYFFPKNNSPG